MSAGPLPSNITTTTRTTKAVADGILPLTQRIQIQTQCTSHYQSVENISAICPDPQSQGFLGPGGDLLVYKTHRPTLNALVVFTISGVLLICSQILLTTRPVNCSVSFVTFFHL